MAVKTDRNLEGGFMLPRLVPKKEGTPMRYKLKNLAALDIALGSLPNRTRVEVDPSIGVSAKTVGELRKLTAWPENLAIITPHAGDAESAVKVSRANVATRTSRKQ